MMDEYKKAIDEQDEMLDDIHHSVKKINTMSNVINKELVEQQDLIIEIEQKTDDTNTRLSRIIKRTDDLIGNPGDNCKLCMIIFLVVVLAGLLLLLFYK